MYYSALKKIVQQFPWVSKLIKRYPEVAKQYGYRAHRLPRIWSNQELKKIAPFFNGSVINVSGWLDEDKEGLTYKDYFSKATSYSISNYSGDRGTTDVEGEIFIDLTADLPSNLYRTFDVVYNHTTLEHIYEVKKAFANLCNLSRDVVILVVPFMQPSHVSETFSDYWRFTPQALRKLFNDNGLQTIYESQTEHHYSSIYLLSVAVRDFEKWENRLPRQQLPEVNVGSYAINHPPLLDRFFSVFRDDKKNSG
jgi:hypothetical protein